MSEVLIGDFQRFFDDLPESVHNDLMFMMVMLSDENVVVEDVQSVYETATLSLFKARTQIGRIADLINAVSVIDVYFAMDVRRRFAPCRSAGSRNAPDSQNARVSAVLDRYAETIGQIENAKEKWRQLRRTTLSPEAIASALIPPGFPKRGSRGNARSLTGYEGHHRKGSHDAIS